MTAASPSATGTCSLRRVQRAPKPALRLSAQSQQVVMFKGARYMQRSQIAVLATAPSICAFATQQNNESLFGGEGRRTGDLHDSVKTALQRSSPHSQLHRPCRLCRLAMKPTPAGKFLALGYAATGKGWQRERTAKGPPFCGLQRRKAVTTPVREHRGNGREDYRAMEPELPPPPSTRSPTSAPQKGQRRGSALGEQVSPREPPRPPTAPELATMERRENPPEIPPPRTGITALLADFDLADESRC